MNTKKNTDTATIADTTATQIPYNKKVQVGWTPEVSDVFLHRGVKGLELLDYASGRGCERLHQVAGGRLYYTSNTGKTGAGYLINLDQVLRVGQYNTGGYYGDM